MRTITRLALLLCPLACGSTAGDAGTMPTTPPPTPPPLTTPSCADGFHALDGEAGCTPTLPQATCAPGTSARIGSAACVPVGVTACPKGFAPHPSGWGCDAILPSKACPRGTRERLGSNTCAPVTDCNAPFPPAGATLFVKATYTPEEIDDSHFLTLSQALAAAQEGATIAVDAGTYNERLTPTKAVTIVGRCAEQVIFSKEDGAGPGLRIENVDVVAKNMTFRGFRGGIAAFRSTTSLSGVVVEDSTVGGITASDAGTVVTLSNVVVRGTRLSVGNNQTIGVVAQNGAKLEIEDSVISDNEFMNVTSTGAGSVTHITQTIVRDGRPPTTGTFAKSFGAGIYVSNGSALTVEESAVIDNAMAGIVVSRGKGAAASGKIARSVVRGTRLDPVRDSGRGIEVSSKGCTVEVEQTTSFGNADIDLIATEGGHADIHDSTTFGSEGDEPAALGGAGLLVSTGGTAKVRSLAVVSARGIGVQVQDTGALEASDSLVLGTRPQPRGDRYGFGINVRDSSTLTLTRSTIERVTTVGLLSEGSAAKLDGVLIRDTQPLPSGVSGRAVSGQDGANLDIARSAFVDNVEAGIILIDGAGSLNLVDSTVANTKHDPSGRFGFGVLLVGGVRATIVSSTVTASEGVALASSGSGAWLTGTTLSRNAVGVHVQDGASLIESDAPITDPLAVVVSKDTRLIDNETRIGSGTVPIPQILQSGP